MRAGFRGAAGAGVAAPGVGLLRRPQGGRGQHCASSGRTADGGRVGVREPVSVLPSRGWYCLPLAAPSFKAGSRNRLCGCGTAEFRKGRRPQRPVDVQTCCGQDGARRYEQTSVSRYICLCSIVLSGRRTDRPTGCCVGWILVHTPQLSFWSSLCSCLLLEGHGFARRQLRVPEWGF